MDVWHATPSHADVFLSSYSYIADNVQPLFHRPLPPSSLFNYSLAHLNSTYHTSYHSLSDISELIAGLRSQAPNLITRSTYGYSYEGRPLEVVHVRNESAQTKASVVVVGSQHAREVFN
jgi:murein tripeptide amidase MpaA